MVLDQRVKQAALNAGLKHLLQNGRRSRERVCRNILELGGSLCSRKVPEERMAEFYEELLGRMQAMDFEELKAWVIDKFGL